MGGVPIEGAIAVVTGGTGGIGAAIADALRGAGATVTTADLPGRGADLDLDVTDLGAQRRALSELQAAHGRLDVVVANAGIGVAGLVEDLGAADWERTIAVNVAGVANTVQAAYPLMVSAGRGSLVLMASLGGLGPVPLMVPYAMSKAAIVGLGASLRIEAARHGVGVTTVCPGPVETPLLDSASRTRGVSVRRYLTTGGGAAIAPERVAHDVVAAIGEDRALVTPGRAAVLARALRLSPGLSHRLVARGLRDELAAAARSG